MSNGRQRNSEGPTIMKFRLWLLFSILAVLVGCGGIQSTGSSGNDSLLGNGPSVGSGSSGNGWTISPAQINELTSGEWTAGETSITANFSPAEAKNLCGATRLTAENVPPGIEVFKQTQARVDLPTSFSWESKDGRSWLSPVKDQGKYGTCVAFATVGAVETMTKITRNNPSDPIDFSEWYLWFKGTNGRNPAGPWESVGAAVAMLNGGTVEERFCPYGLVPNYVEPPTGTPLCKAASTPPPRLIVGKDKMKETLLAGPLVGTMEVFEDFYWYFNDLRGRGVYRHVLGRSTGGHAFLIVGYDDASSCWNCKNSWGRGWGDSGMFRIRYDQIDQVGLLYPALNFSTSIPNPNPPPNPDPSPTPPPASPNAPSLASPNAGAVVPGEVNFQWQGQGGPNFSGNFALRVRDPQGNQVLDRGWFPDTEFRWTPTSGAGQYTWSVSAGATGGAAEARSEVRTFTVPLISPNPPLLLSPYQGGVAGKAQEVRFRWQGQGGPNASGQYSLRVFAPNGTKVLDRPWVAETDYGWTPSAGPGTYTWNVHAGATSGAVESISETRSFVLPVFSPAAPGLVSPYPASIVPVNGGIHFRWLGNQDVNSTGAFALRVWDPQGVKVLDYGWHHDQDYDWTPTSGPGTYRWLVSAGASPGVPETESEVRTFVVANDVPNLPTLTFPDPYRVVGVHDSIRFQWQGRGGANAVGNYKLSLWDPQGRLFEQDWTQSQEATWLPNVVSGTDTWPSGTYQWMVTAQATPGFQSVQSEVRTFTVQPGLVSGVHIAQRDTMLPNEVLLPNQTIVSPDGRYKFTLQWDGNVVLYKNGTQPLWASNTSNTPAFLLMAPNGNLVLYDTGGNARWNATLRGSATANSHLLLQDDGNVVIYRPDGSAIWATDTGP